MVKMGEKTKLIIGSSIGLVISTGLIALVIIFLEGDGKLMILPLLLPLIGFLDGLISNIRWDGKSIRYIDMG